MTSPAATAAARLPTSATNLDQEPDGGVIDGETLDDDQGDQGDQGPSLAEQRAMWQQMIDHAQRTLPSSRLPATPGAPVAYCRRCRAAQRRVGGRWPVAVASIEAPSALTTNVHRFDHAALSLGRPQG